MSRSLPRQSPLLLALVLAIPSLTRAGEPTTALSVQFLHPDRQLERLLALFDGSAAPHPAAALAAWRRATGDPDVLNKTRQALIATLNPEMVRELRTLDGATLTLDIDARGRVGWSLAVPRDDGTLAALGAALALTDGASEPPLGEAAVDRLGPSGSPLMARRGTGVVVAGNRDDLADGLARLEAGPREPATLATGWLVHLDAESLADSGRPAARQIGSALSGLGIETLRAEVNLERDALTVKVATRPDPVLCATAIDPAWLDAIPSETSVAFAVAFDPAPATWNRLFDAADRIEKSDPDRARTGPLRARLNLLANAAGLRPERDFWPHLRGVSGFATVAPDGELDGAFVALHATDEPHAIRWKDRLLPRLAWALGVGDGRAVNAGPIAAVAGRRLFVERRGSSVWIGWGEAVLARAAEAIAHPDLSAGPRLRATWADRPVARCGAVWPARPPLPRWQLPAGSFWQAALAGAPPVVWWAEPSAPGSDAHDRIRWNGLHDTVRRLLDQLPLQAPQSD